MGSTFNPQILVDKLAKLNNSQQSIETKQVVETWARQFHCSPRDQRLAYLYLANDILQNSRRKGAEFVGEFWRVLPDALRDVIQNGDDFGRNSALRLINIWNERKVFGSRGNMLKEEFAKNSENSPTVGKQSSLKMRHGMGIAVDKIVSGYEVVYGGQLDEDAVLNRCRSAISCVEKVEKDIGGENSGQFNGSGFVGELQGQNAALTECIEQLRVLETSRANLVSHLREALREQEFKLDQVRNQIKAAQLRSEQATSICQQLLNSNNVELVDALKEAVTSPVVPKGNGSDDREQSGPVVYTREVPFTEKGGSGVAEDDPKSAAAAIAAQLTSSSSSAQMLTIVLSSLAQEGLIGSGTTGTAPMKETPAAEYPCEKRPKLEDVRSSYVALPPQQPPSSPHPDNLQQNGTSTSQQVFSAMQPPPPSSPPPQPPHPPFQPYAMPQFMQAGPVSSMSSFTYGPNQQPHLPLYLPAGPPVPGMPPFAQAAPPANPYQSFQAPDGRFYNQAPSMSRP